MAKLIFKGKKKKKKVYSRPNLTITTSVSKLLQLPRKGTKKQRSSNFGNYPVPTGRILERYAHKHKLDEALPIAKKALSDTIIGVGEKINRSKPKKKLQYHEATRRFKNVNPYKDSDGDGVVNMADCRPFNKNKQDEEMKDYYGPHGKDVMDDDYFEVEEDVTIMYDEEGHARKTPAMHIPQSSKNAKPRGVTVTSRNVKTVTFTPAKKTKCNSK